MSTHIRVSEILAQFKDFSTINPKVLNTKAAIGTEVHHNIHMHTKGVFPVHEMYPNYDRSTTEITSWEERGEGYLNSYLAYDKKEKPKYQLMEHRLYDDNLMITGQIDGLRVMDGLPMLIDFKCSYSVDKEIWGMQAHYYKHLLEVNGIQIADTFLFLQLKKDGKKPTLVEIKFDEEVMSRCIDEAILFWERKKDAK
jgi:hypothetical protein